MLRTEQKAAPGGIPSIPSPEIRDHILRAKPVKADKHGAGLCILGGATQGP